jgi:RNA polymerase sigma-70 factor (ECF subfamily)
LRNAEAIQSEAALISLAQTGNQEAFSELVLQHTSRIFRVSLRLLKNREDAEDNLQNTLLKAFCQIRRFKKESQFSTWLFRIATNEALMSLRSRRSRDIQNDAGVAEKGENEDFDLPDPVSNPERQYMCKEYTSTILRGLAPKLKSILLLQKMEGWTTGELAEKFGVTAQCIKYRSFRARRMLVKKMKRTSMAAHGVYRGHLTSSKIRPS